MMMAASKGFQYLPAALDPADQQTLLASLRALLIEAPLYRPTMPRSGRPLSVMMSNAGSHGWYSDKDGYRYIARHPETARPWPSIPGQLLALWRAVTDYPAPPQCCLINFYGEGTRMGLHQDRDEDAIDAPVLSLSLGDSAVFRLGGPSRKDPTGSLRLHSGDLVVLGGESRLAFHGIDRVLGGSSRLLPQGGRINITLRRVTRPAPDPSSPDEALGG